MEMVKFTNKKKKSMTSDENITAVGWLKKVMQEHNTNPFDNVEWQIALEFAEQIEKDRIAKAFNNGRNVGRDGSPGIDGEYYYEQVYKSK
jgi:hypothetical protein